MTPAPTLTKLCIALKSAYASLNASSPASVQRYKLMKSKAKA
jgi:hypothetical protein